MNREKHYAISALMRAGLKKMINRNKRVMIILNRKGYAAGYRCPHCNHIPYCTACDIPLAIHKSHDGSFFGMCHVCHYHVAHIDTCPSCGRKHDPTYSSYGYGLQQLHDDIVSLTGMTPLHLESRTTNSLTKIKKIDMSTHNIVIGTSLLTTLPTNRTPDMCIIAHADAGLTIPDYSAQRHTFCMIHSFLTKFPDAIHIIQTRNPDHHVIQYALRQDYQGMYTTDMKYRTDHGYPPIRTYARLLYKNEIEEKMFNKVNGMYHDLLYLASHHFPDDIIDIIPTPPLIYKKYGKYRYTILIRGDNIRVFCDEAARTLSFRKKGFFMDWLPGSLIS